MEQDISKLKWKEAATGGLLLGLALSLLLVLDYVFRANEYFTVVSGALKFILLALAILFFTKRVAKWHGDEGFTIMQSMSFIVKLMLFAGILIGLTQFVLQNYVDPQYYIEEMENTLLKSGIDEDKIELILASSGWLKNPLINVLSGILNLVLYGGLIGLVLSPFIKRLPNHTPRDNSGFISTEL